MDRKIKLLAAISVIALMASGCSSRYLENGGSNASSSRAGSSQVSRGGVFSQRRAETCAPCSASGNNTYTYKPAAKPVYKTEEKPKPAGQHDQQYYVDKWKREQKAQQSSQNNQNYTGYGNTDTNNTTYYDYSTAGKTNTPAPNVTTSNKSIYTGSYQQPTYKPYQPTTYAGGSSATTNTTTPAATGAGSTYLVKKGDTVFEVMRQTGVYWKDIISMNNLVAPAYTIVPGQTLRLK